PVRPDPARGRADRPARGAAGRRPQRLPPRAAGRGPAPAGLLARRGLTGKAAPLAFRTPKGWDCPTRGSAPGLTGEEKRALTGTDPNAMKLRRKPFRVKHLCRTACGGLREKDIFLI